MEIKKNRRKRRFLLLSVLCATCYRTQAAAARQISPRGGDLSSHFGRGFASFRPAGRHPPDAVAHHAHHAARSRVRLALRATSPNPPLPPHARERDRHRDHTTTGTATTDGLADTNAATATARASERRRHSNAVGRFFVLRARREDERDEKTRRRRGGGEAAAFLQGRGANKCSGIGGGDGSPVVVEGGRRGGCQVTHRLPTADDGRGQQPTGRRDGRTDRRLDGRTDRRGGDRERGSDSERARARARAKPPGPGHPTFAAADRHPAAALPSQLARNGMMPSRLFDQI